MISAGSRWLIVAGFGLAQASLLAGQASSPCAATSAQSAGQKISPQKLTQLLREPNGWENAARLAGHISVDGELRSINTFDMKSAIARSELVAVGTVTTKKSEIFDDESEIFTNYTMHVNTLLKGTVNASGNVAFSIVGGYVCFANGTSAEITTMAWRYIEVGKPYLAFLYKSSPSEDTFSITGGVEGLGRLTSPAGGFELAADLDKGRPHAISDRPKSMTLSDLANMIKSAH